MFIKKGILEEKRIYHAVGWNSEITKHFLVLYFKLDNCHFGHFNLLNYWLITRVAVAAKRNLITMQFVFFLGVKNGLAWRCPCWKHVKKTHQYFKTNFRKSRSLNARHKWNQTHGEEETLFQKFFHFRFVLPACLTFWVLEEFFNILEKYIFPRYEIQMFEIENCTRWAD